MARLNAEVVLRELLEENNRILKENNTILKENQEIMKENTRLLVSLDDKLRKITINTSSLH